MIRIVQKKQKSPLGGFFVAECFVCCQSLQYFSVFSIRHRCCCIKRKHFDQCFIRTILTFENKNMSKAKSAAAKIEQTSAHLKGASGDGRINTQMIQNVFLVWLDSKIDEKSNDCRNTIAQLRRAVDTVKIFTDCEQCIQFLENIDKEKACMVVSGALGQQIVPRLQNMSQVDSIFIFCGNRKYHEQWAKDWSKIKGVFTEIKSICEALKQAAQRCEENAVSISIMGAGGDLSKKDLDQLDPSFMYTQIMTEILSHHYIRATAYSRISSILS